VQPLTQRPEIECPKKYSAKIPEKMQNDALEPACVKDSVD
jgi:hypothetical protein